MDKNRCGPINTSEEWMNLDLTVTMQLRFLGHRSKTENDNSNLSLICSFSNFQYGNIGLFHTYIIVYIKFLKTDLQV